MKNRFKTLIIIYLTIIVSIFSITTYLSNSKKRTAEDIRQIEAFVSITKLPDLAISNEAMSIRHRSLADISSIFKESPELNEYFPTTFTYNHSTIHYNTPSKVKE